MNQKTKLRLRVLTLICSCISFTVTAKQYGSYDPTQVIAVSVDAAGQHTVSINMTYFNLILDDLGPHAFRFPVNFDSSDDKHRAEHDVAAVSALFDPIAKNDVVRRDPKVLLRLGILHAIGHNLDIPGASQKAINDFSTLLQLTPDDPKANYTFGVFLAGTAQNASAIPFLQKARARGKLESDYWLGVVYASLGDKPNALESLRSYIANYPSDVNANRMLDAIQHDRVYTEQPSKITH